MQSQSNKTETVYKLHFLCREINQTQMTRHHSPRDVWLVLVIFCVFTFRGCEGDRDSKLLNVFNIVKFPNDGCSTVSGTYGVCYTASECDTLGQDNNMCHNVISLLQGGSGTGTCASGFGVCCLFSGTCGQSTGVNNTYFKVRVRVKF